MKNTIESAIEYYKRKEFIKVIEILVLYLKSYEDTEAYNILAMAYYNLDDSTNSITYLKKALEMEPENINYLNNLAIAYLSNSEEKSIDTFELVLQIQPNNTLARNTLGDIYFRRGDSKKTILHYDRVLNYTQASFNTLYNFITILYDLGEYHHSLQYINKALNMKKDNAELELLAADIYYQLDMPIQSTEHYKMYLSLKSLPMDFYTFSKIKKANSGYIKKKYDFSKIREKSYTDAYKKAIDENVKDKTVLTYANDGGLFSMMALKAGANKVYLIQKDTHISTQIQEIIRSNGYGDKVEFIKEPLFLIDNIKVDVVIVDKFGDGLINENIMSDIRFINDNFVHSGVKFIPSKAKIYAKTINTTLLNSSYKEYGFDMSTFDIYEDPYIYKNLNEIDHITTSQKFEVFDFDFYNPQTLDHKIIKPNYIKNNSTTIALWYELDFQTHKLNTLSGKKDQFKHLIWSLDLQKDTQLEFIFNKNHIFIGKYLEKGKNNDSV